MSRNRIDSIDLLRGLVIVLMGLDHVRDYFGPTPFRPEDLSQASAALFLTRWVTHFCVPVFLFLAGLGAALYLSRGHTRGEATRFLLSRGLLCSSSLRSTRAGCPIGTATCSCRSSG